MKNLPYVEFMGILTANPDRDFVAFRPGTDLTKESPDDDEAPNRLTFIKRIDGEPYGFRSVNGEFCATWLRQAEIQGSLARMIDPPERELHIRAVVPFGDKMAIILDE